jgi:Outer membrane protein beta-barrel domain
MMFMKKQFSSVFVLLLLFFLDSTAQNFKAGVLAGITTSQVSGDNLGGFHKAGMLAGTYVTTKIGDSSAIQMELLFVQKGSQQAQDLEKGKAFYQIRLNYAEVPLLYKLKIKRFTYEIGASIGFLIDSKVSNALGPYPAGSTESRPFKKTEASVCAGLNYRIYNHFSVNWRFTNSFLPIRDHLGGSYKLNKGQYNTAMYFSLRYDFK